jgi:hypothetical protein
MPPACNTSNDEHIGASIPYSLSKGSYKDSDVCIPARKQDQPFLARKATKEQEKQTCQHVTERTPKQG